MTSFVAFPGVAALVITTPGPDTAPGISTGLTIWALTTSIGLVAVLIASEPVLSAMTFAWLALYAALVARAGDVLRRAPIRRVIEGTMGAILVALGVRLAGESR